MHQATSLSDRTQSGSGRPPEGALRIEQLAGIEPLDDQIGVDPKACAPAGLYDALFNHPDPSQPLRTYAILDAAKHDGLVDAIEASGLPHECLFTGDAEQDLGAVAPWLVQLDEHSSLTRNLFSHDPETEIPWFYWHLEPGFYLRSSANLQTLRAHFRKFTRVQDEAGQWFYLRFWEPSWTALLLRDMTPRERSEFFGPVASLITPRISADCEVLTLTAEAA